MILACSAVKIRSLLKSLHNAFPNEKFIGIHVFNSVLYTFLFFVLTILMITQNRISNSLKNHYDEDTALLNFKLLFFYNVVYIVLLAF